MAEIPNTTPALNETGEFEPRNRDGLWDGRVPEIAFSNAELLERGGPWEILPSALIRWTMEAQRYCDDRAGHPEEARRRVREVWLEGKYRPAWLGESAKAVGS